MAKLIVCTFAVLFCVGCASVRVPDGPTAVALGQSEAKACVTNEAGVETCTTATGGSLSDGAVDLFKGLFTLPGSVLRGVGSGLP